MNWKDIIFNILISITASFFFWLLTFKLSFVKIIYANCLVKSENTLTSVKKPYGYRFRVANIGIRDLVEITIVAKLIIKDTTRSHICELDISNSGTDIFVTDFPGIISYKIKGCSNIKTLTLYPSDSMRNELSKKLYPKKIRKLAKKRKIQFKDIFDEYGENASIRVYLYGNDKTTGARKMFKSQSYTLKDIKEGEFYGSKEVHFSIFNCTKRNIISKTYKKSDII